MVEFRADLGGAQAVWKQTPDFRLDKRYVKPNRLGNGGHVCQKYFESASGIIGTLRNRWKGKFNR
jgi:hypothetical protein